MSRLALPWADVVRQDETGAAVHDAREAGRAVADAFYGADEDALIQQAPTLYAAVINDALERGEISAPEMEEWTVRLATGSDADPRIAAFADALIRRIGEWRQVRALAGEAGVRTMVRRMELVPEDVSTESEGE